jgi:hypothetical protein
MSVIICHVTPGGGEGLACVTKLQIGQGGSKIAQRSVTYYLNDHK